MLKHRARHSSVLPIDLKGGKWTVVIQAIIFPFVPSFSFLTFFLRLIQSVSLVNSSPYSVRFLN